MKQRNKKISKEQLEEVYYKKGITNKELCSILKISMSTYYRLLKDYNIKRKKHIIEDLTGQIFGDLTVIKYIKSGRYYDGGTYHVWECICKCGKIVNVRAGNLKFSGLHMCLSCRGKESSVKLKECPIDYNVWYRIKERARTRGLELTVTPEYLYNLFLSQGGKCALSGIPIFFGELRKNETTASPDRIDSDKGYIEGNIHWVHKTVNIMKNDLSSEEFKNWCHTISDFWRNRS